MAAANASQSGSERAAVPHARWQLLEQVYRAYKLQHQLIRQVLHQHLYQLSLCPLQNKAMSLLLPLLPLLPLALLLLLPPPPPQG